MDLSEHSKQFINYYRRPFRLSDVCCCGCRCSRYHIENSYVYTYEQYICLWLALIMFRLPSIVDSRSIARDATYYLGMPKPVESTHPIVLILLSAASQITHLQIHLIICGAIAARTWRILRLNMVYRLGESHLHDRVHNANPAYALHDRCLSRVCVLFVCVFQRN